LLRVSASGRDFTRPFARMTASVAR